jgi:hypothetical protein
MNKSNTVGRTGFQWGWRGNQEVEGRSLYLFADPGVVDHQFQTKAFGQSSSPRQKTFVSTHSPGSSVFSQYGQTDRILSPQLRRLRVLRLEIRLCGPMTRDIGFPPRSTPPFHLCPLPTPNRSPLHNTVPTWPEQLCWKRNP